MPEIIKYDAHGIGSDDWFRFLALPGIISFRYEGRHGTFTARKRQDGKAWNAYKKKFNRLRVEYLGLSHAVGLERLEHIAQKLSLSDIEYWGNKTHKGNVGESDRAKAAKRIIELEEQLAKALADIERLDYLSSNFF